MGTEVLYPQHCFNHRFGFTPVPFHRRRSYGNPNPNPIHNNNHRKPRKRSLESAIAKRSPSSEDLSYRSNKQSNNNNHKSLASGQVAMLKRGESFDVKIKGDDECIISGSEQLGSDPEMVPKQTNQSPASPDLSQDMYAGSAFYLSPSPSSVPLPSFFSRKVTDDSATRDLRRLLRLD